MASPPSSLPQDTPESHPVSDPTPFSEPEPESDLKQGDVEEEEEEEEEEECGFCLFMKGGGCKDEFIAWEECVESAEKSGENVVDKCFDVTSTLKKCMDAHADYYEPLLKAEQAMADSIAEEPIDERSIAEEPSLEKKAKEEVKSAS